MTVEGPWKRGKVNRILYTNDPMPRNEWKKVDKSRKLPWKHYISKQMLNYISTKSPKVPLCPWAEKWIHLSQKRTLWIEEPESKFIKKGIHKDSYERQKFKRHRRVQNCMGMRNKWIFLFTLCFYPVASKLEATRR